MALTPPRDWQPSIKQEEFRGILRKYQTNPELFDEDSLHDLETHASYYQLPFARSEQHQANFVGKVLKNLGKGFIEGWTTIPTDKDIPFTNINFGGAQVRDTTEGIARSLGHLAGFVGYLPFGKYLPLYRAIRGQSIPLKASRKINNMVAPKAKAMIQEAGPWAQKFAEGTLGSDLASGAFHLGVASAVSSWTEGIDTMIESGKHGAIFGGVFRGIGNLPGFGKQITASQLSLQTGRPQLSKLEPGQKVDLSLRTLAGSMFQGLPSTMQGATTEEQVYAYLLGAYFGFGETPLATRTSREFMTELIRDRIHRDGPEASPRWKELTPTMQEQIKKDYEVIFGPEGELSAFAFDLLDGRNWSAEKTEQLAKELGVEIGITEGGEPFRKITREDIKELKRIQLEKKNEEDPQDLDMHFPDWDAGTIKRFKVIGDSFMPYIEKYMSRLEIVKDASDPHIENVKIAQKIFAKWESLQKPIGESGELRPKPNAEKDMKKFIYEEFGTGQTKKEIDWWRNYVEVRRNVQPYMPYYLVDGKPREMDLEGKNVLQREKVAHIQPPLIQNIYNQLFGAKYNRKDKRPFLTWFDHEVIDGKEYNLLEVRRIIRARERYKLEKQYNFYGEKVTAKQIDAATDKAMTKRRSRLFKMLNERGYYYLGGRGDKKRMYFVKYHPDMVPKRKQLAKRIKELRKAYSETSNDKIKMTPKEFDKFYKLGKNRFKYYIYSGKDADLLYDKALVSNMMYDLSFNAFQIPKKGELGIGRVLENGFINEAKGYNKRAQIWLNTGIAANEDYVAKRVKDALKNKSGGRAFKFFVYTDPENPKEMKINVPARLQAEFYDGGSIMRRDVLEALNSDKGLPFDGGANKSFIVSPRENKGTVLGKYMFHVASPKMNKWMNDNNIHFIMPKSGIKQLGRMEAIKDIPSLERIFQSGKTPPKKYLNEVPIHHIRTVMSEITSEKNINPARVAKQIFTTVSLYGHKDVNPETFNKFIEEMTGRAYNGEAEFNEMLKDYKNTQNVDTMRKVLDNIESVSLGDLLEIMKDPKYEHFAQKAYERILKVNESIIKELGEEGELTREEVLEEIKENRQFQGVLDRIQQLYPEGDVGGAHHKWAKGYRMVAMRNYIVNSMTKPKIKNSGTARMRPYDWGYRDAIRNMRENEYFLDDGYKKKVLYDEMLPGGKMKMGDMWNELQKPKGKGLFPSEPQREYAKEMLQALVMRVPMDSMSGAHVLDFRGFTSMGTSDSYGVLIHPRSMRALGGADLDGDKAHLYFGGNQHGLRKEYKDIYKAQYNEFISNPNKESLYPDKKNIPNADNFNKLPSYTGTSGRYAGIGSRRTPPPIKKEIAELAEILDRYDYRLRTGDAKGADEAFGLGVINATGYGSREGTYDKYTAEDATDLTRTIAKEIHPLGQKLDKERGLDLHARNTNQIFGRDLNNPADFVIAWTPGGQMKGGTAQAMRMAEAKGIPIINLASKDWRYKLQEVLLKDFNVKYEKSVKPRAGKEHEIVAAHLNRDAKEIVIDRALLKEKFAKKAWTTMSVKGAKKIPKDAFKTYEEFENFVLAHEKAHIVTRQRENESHGAYESRVNDLAFENLRRLEPLEMHNKESIDPHWGVPYKEHLISNTRAGRESQSPYGYYDPYARYHMSMGAAEGRDTLSAAVVGRANVIGAYNAIRGAEGRTNWKVELTVNGKKEEHTGYIGNGEYAVPFVHKAMGSDKEVVKVAVFKIKTGETDLERFRGMARASVALGSDPMDEAGLKNVWDIRRKVLDTLFDYEIHDITGKYGQKINHRLTNALKAGMYGAIDIRKYGLHNEFSSVNNAIYGKDFKTGRRHGFAEIMRRVNSMNHLPASAKNTMMPKLAEKLSKLDWSDNILRRVDITRWKELLAESNQFAFDNAWLKEKLGRSSLVVPENQHIMEVINRELYKPEVLEQYVNIDKKWEQVWDKRYDVGTKRDRYKDKFILGDPFPEAMFPRGIKLVNGKPSKEIGKEEWFRRAWLRQAVLKAEDFIVNDISDMVTLKRITTLLDTYDIPESRIKELIQHANQMKRSSYLNTQRRGQERIDVSGSTYGRGAKKTDKFSAKLDQFDIDMQIRGFKENLTKGEKELYDTFLIGTYSTSDLKQLQNLKKIPFRERTDEQNQEIRQLELAADNTSLSQVGYNSKAVSNTSIKRFFDQYSKYWKKVTSEDANPKEMEKVFKEDEVVDFVDDAGKIVKGKIMEEADYNPATKRYLREVHPFIGIEKGKVKDPELREAYHNIRNHLDAMHNSDAASLNFFFRELTRVNINEAKKTDWLDFSRALDMMNGKTFWNKAWDAIFGESEAPKRPYYWQFPAAINRDLLKKSPAFKQLVETVSPYKDHLGNTIMGKTLTPMSPVAEMQQLFTKAGEMSMQVIDLEKKNFREKLSPYLSTLKEGDELYRIAVSVRERSMKNVLHQDEPNLNSVLRANQMMYENAYTRIRDRRKELADVSHKVNIDGKTKIFTGEQILENINKVITDQNIRMHRMLVGDPKKIEKWLDITKDKYGYEDWAGLDKLRWEWGKYVNELLRKGERIPIEEIGIDGIRQISKRILFSHIPLTMRTAKRLAEVTKSVKINKERDVTGKFPFNFYYPHISNDKKMSDVHVRKAIDDIYGAGDLTKEEKNFYAAKLLTHQRQMNGDTLAKDEMGENFALVQQIYNDAAAAKTKNAELILKNDLKVVGNQFSRKAHLDGYDRSPEAYEQYMRSIIKTFYDQAIQVQSRTVINDFSRRYYKQNKNNWDTDAKKLGKAWSDFFTLYAQGAMGHPVHIPEHIMDNPLMKIKKTPYKWFADSQTKKRIDGIRKQLGVGRKALKKWNLDDETIDKLTGIEYAQLNSWSALEAKYQLASLLAHPKSSIANLYGGSVHTVVSTGWRHWRNARNFEYLKTHVNPEWRGMEDVEKHLQKLGVQEEFLIHQAGMNPEVKSKRWDSFVRDATKKIKKDPEFSDRSLLDLKRTYKLSDTAWNFAASFMRRPERVLRRDAYMAHLLQAKELFGNAIKDYDHPFLVEMAKRGVKATQFLYSAPHRPMWTNSALGRVFSRFQLWSWNSVRFRNDVLRDAKIRGFVRGTPEYDKFIRLAQADLFMLGLSNLFMYSLFENALPAPWNWFQDTADWLMGDEAAQERAFYGSPFGPVQMVTPPALRLLPPLFKGMVQDDYSKLTDYYLWTMLPFGRLIRDIWGPGGAIENPYYSVTKMTGLPVLETGELFRGGKKKEEEEE